MDESDFLRGIEGNRQNESDFMSGAEHLVRLKKQVGWGNHAEDLDKIASEACTAPKKVLSGPPKDPIKELSPLASILSSAREKTANRITEHLKDINPGVLAATGLGALIGGTGTYLSSRPHKETGKSNAEEKLEQKVDAAQARPETGLLSKLRNRNTELEHGYAKAFREHPVKAGLLGAVTGGMGGYGIARLAGGISNLRKG